MNGFDKPLIICRPRDAGPADRGEPGVAVRKIPTPVLERRDVVAFEKFFFHDFLYLPN
jgi:hypothetical protein